MAKKQLKMELNDDTQLVQDKHVENTPFYIRKREDKYIVTVGNSRLSKTFDSYDDALAEVMNPSWDTYTTLIFEIVALALTHKEE